MNTQEAKLIIETALLCAQEPLELGKLRKLFDGRIGSDTVRFLLKELQLDWQNRGIELTALASGWRFQSQIRMGKYLEQLRPERLPKYSRAVMETLAIIAYRQPVTRGDIEDIRGVGVSSHILKQLEDRNWIEVIGQREVAGRPSLYATTKNFLDDIGLKNLTDLPAVMDTLAVSQLTPAVQQAIASKLDNEPELPPSEELNQPFVDSEHSEHNL